MYAELSNKGVWKMSRGTRPEVDPEVTFWMGRGESYSVLGDWSARKPIMELLNPSATEKVLDAGCADGFMTRRIAWRGAHVTGIDRKKGMIAVARQAQHEALLPTLAGYDLGDITQMQYPPESFDAVLCSAVLMFLTESEILAFYENAYQALRPGGRLVISVTHPDVYQPNSPQRTGQTGKWSYEALQPDVPLTSSQLFREVYPSTARIDPLVSDIWHHPEGVYLSDLPIIGFKVQTCRATVVTSEILQEIHSHAEGRKPYGTAVGYNAFLQYMAIKE
jgi:SAM-dependent methyltransferase